MRWRTSSDMGARSSEQDRGSRGPRPLHEGDEFRGDSTRAGSGARRCNASSPVTRTQPAAVSSRAHRWRSSSSGSAAVEGGRRAYSVAISALTSRPRRALVAQSPTDAGATPRPAYTRSEAKGAPRETKARRCAHSPRWRLAVPGVMRPDRSRAHAAARAAQGQARDDQRARPLAAVALARVRRQVQHHHRAGDVPALRRCPHGAGLRGHRHHRLRTSGHLARPRTGGAEHGGRGRGRLRQRLPDRAQGRGHQGLEGAHHQGHRGGRGLDLVAEVCRLHAGERRRLRQAQDHQHHGRRGQLPEGAPGQGNRHGRGVAALLRPGHPRRRSPSTRPSTTTGRRRWAGSSRCSP